MQHRSTDICSGLRHLVCVITGGAQGIGEIVTVDGGRMTLNYTVPV